MNQPLSHNIVQGLQGTSDGILRPADRITLPLHLVIISEAKVSSLESQGTAASLHRSCSRAQQICICRRGLLVHHSFDLDTVRGVHHDRHISVRLLDCSVEDLQ